jgi:transcriptional regulator with XRE-family HTH domain
VKTLFDYERFEALRVSRGITKRFIAQSLGRSSTLVQDWKLQKSQPNGAQLAEVARILGTTPEYLRGETDEVAPDSGRDEELQALLEELREREDMRMLFKLARDASPEDVRQAVRIIEALRRDD